ncbi:amidohydrolase [Rhodomicrobium vannielii ATCC 17100]|uniref:Amidohydrolase n=1 Tax=Rhodomicrobium vannielii (strain ATCC 17100 / DSM 162 / LMG 4299 / NCIMB 10020 / ATH 3.1.1) TaxID=648757 RepID=E3I8P3_RHOVT|nr:hypothetical protein [Rhodomicrobium vannielii]ADP72022.1 amidohydrolase [Rhodomicrobium vannielii ATCC 17100]
MARKPSKAAIAAAALKEARSFIAARNRARTRAEAPGGGDPFFRNYEIAQGHLARLSDLIGEKRAGDLIRAEEQKGFRYVFESKKPPQRKR